MIFYNAWLLLLLLFIPLLWWRWNRRTFKTGISYCSAIDVSLLPTSFRSKTLWIPALLRTIAIIVLIVCVARPQKRFEKIKQADKNIVMQQKILNLYLSHEYTFLVKVSWGALNLYFFIK